LGRRLLLGDFASIGSVDLIDVVSSDFLAAFEGELLMEIGAVEEAVVVVEEGCDILGNKAHGST
jgi:hypothetical protein